MANDPHCKYRRSCGYDFCMGEGMCPDFEKGRPVKEESEVKYEEQNI